jgi:hypothetical protein
MIAACESRDAEVSNDPAGHDVALFARNPLGAALATLIFEIRRCFIALSNLQMSGCHSFRLADQTEDG